MSKALSDITQVFLLQIRESRDEDTPQLPELYLRSADEKLRFAEHRLRSLRGRIVYHKGGRRVTQHEGWSLKMYPQNRLQIQMDYDHCVLSLRSSLEHLAQLVNAIIPLKLPPKGKPSKSVSLNNVITEISARELLARNPNLSELASYLKTEKQSDWFKDLHDLRIELFHDRSNHLRRTETETLDGQLLDLKFLLPDGTVTGAKTDRERDILFYLKGRVKDVKRVLETSFVLLGKYMSDKYGNEWLETSENQLSHS